MPETFTPLQTLSAAAFVDGIGADTHIAYTDGEYSSISLVLSDLEYLGIDQIRDGISDRENGSAPITSYISLAQAGIQFTFIIQASDDAELQSQLQLVNEVEAAAPGSIIAIEGPNEINNAPVTFDGTAGLAGALDLQAALVADLHADRLLAGVAVDYFTGYDTGTIGLGPDPVADGLANYDNQHPYPTDGEPPASSVSRAQALPNTTFANEPAVYTETGYSTDKVNQDVQAVYELDLLMDTARDGISKTYLYDLLDAYAPGSPQGDDGFGLFGYTKAPKEVAVDLHNLTGILREAGTGTAISQTGSISFAISGLPSTGNALVLNEPNGNVLLSVWAEPKIWDNASGSELAAPAETVTITPDGAYSAALVFDPTAGTAAIATLTSGKELTISITDHPVLVDCIDPAPACFAAGTRILTAGGQVAVENLASGDIVITHTGETEAIIWIGRRRIDLARHPDPARVQPICVAAGALGDDLPARDLVLSPDHALYLDGVLIPVKALVNHSSIRQLRRPSVTYYHIELVRHAVVFAEHLTVESYLDTGNRGAFENGGAVVRLHPDFAQKRRERQSCAPLHESGPVVEGVRRQAALRLRRFG